MRHTQAHRWRVPKRRCKWMRGKRWQLLNNKRVLILLLKHWTKHIIRFNVETCSVFMHWIFFGPGTHSRTDTDGMEKNRMHFGLHHIALFLSLKCISVLIAFTRNKERRTDTTNRQKEIRVVRRSGVSVSVWVCKRQRKSFLIYTNTSFYFRLFHSMSDKLYTKCKQMNWVHVNLSYCLERIFVYIRCVWLLLLFPIL